MASKVSKPISIRKLAREMGGFTFKTEREMKKKINIEVGDKLIFKSGNFAGLTGVVRKVDFHSTDKRAIYGYLHEVALSNGNTGYIEKSEHWDYAK